LEQDTSEAFDIEGLSKHSYQRADLSEEVINLTQLSDRSRSVAPDVERFESFEPFATPSSSASTYHSFPAGLDGGLKRWESGPSFAFRLPASTVSAIPYNDDMSEDTCCCFRCHCERCLSHCWFMLACCSFVLVSSLPRFMAVMDGLVAVILYITYVRTNQGDLSVWDYIRDDFEHFDFHTSVLTVVWLCLARSFILFFTYAYRFHLRPSTFYISTVVMVVSSIYLAVKMALNESWACWPLLVFAMIIGVLEYAVYISVRRRRIRFV